MSIAAFSRSRLFWTMQIGGWFGLVPVFIGMNIMAGAGPAAAILNGIFRQAVGFVLTLGLRHFFRRWARVGFSPWRLALIAVPLAAGATVIDHFLFHFARTSVGVRLVDVPRELIDTAATLVRIILYGAWSTLYLNLHYFLDLRERDLRLARAEIATRDVELQVLRAQLNPHFLFNALNTIVAEADDDPARVKAITAGLSQLLRFSLQQRDHFGVLGDEIAAVESYLAVERLRFEERLVWRTNFTPEARAARVPTALLLPLVENAIKYGLQTSPGPLELHLGAYANEDGVVVYVENSGHWVDPDPTSTRSTGIGLANLRRRLDLLCGPQSRILTSFPPGMVRVEVRVPPADSFS
jgi:hypothetical protein